MRSMFFRALAGAAVCAGLLLTWAASLQAEPPAISDACVVVDPDPPEYYKIDLVSTRKLPGTRMAEGVGHVTFAHSPFGVALSPRGNYIYDLNISVDDLKPPRSGVYVAWVSTPNLDVIDRLGPLDENMSIQGTVDFNKFLVIITLEPSAEGLGPIWQGPIALRGMSKSGFMHTMAGHGPFEQEPCTSFGYN